MSLFEMSPEKLASMILAGEIVIPCPDKLSNILPQPAELTVSWMQYEKYPHWQLAASLDTRLLTFWKWPDKEVDAVLMDRPQMLIMKEVSKDEMNLVASCFPEWQVLGLVRRTDRRLLGVGAYIRPVQNKLVVHGKIRVRKKFHTWLHELFNSSSKELVFSDFSPYPVK